jgi:type I restriction enzyme S subunit
MAAKYRPYPVYKPSGVEWLGDIPEGWEAKKLKFSAANMPSNVDKKTKPGEQKVKLCNYTDVYYSEVIEASMSFMIASASAEQAEKFTLLAGDTIITKDSEDPNDIAIPAFVRDDLAGVVCGYHLSVIRPFSVEFGSYIKRCFECSFARAYFAVSANGLTRYGLGAYPLDNVVFPVPSSVEASKIAAFLDHETAKIDALIAKQQRLIALLEEKRQAVISHAVTKGLDLTVPLRPSGIDWLGDVPEHWAMKPLKWLTDPKRPIMYGIVLPGPDVGEGIPILKGGNVKPAKMNLNSMARTTPAIEVKFARARLKSGDLVVAIRGTIGDCEPVPPALENSNITQDVARVAIDANHCAAWARWMLLADVSQAILAGGSLGATIPGINIFDLKRIKLPTPPPSEQRDIAAFVSDKTKKFDDLLTQAASAITLLKERRTALISAAVTGKIDLRDWQAPEGPTDISTQGIDQNEEALA